MYDLNAFKKWSCPLEDKQEKRKHPAQPISWPSTKTRMKRPKILLLLLLVN
jgi:hypothetical protein